MKWRNEIIQLVLSLFFVSSVFFSLFLYFSHMNTLKSQNRNKTRFNSWQDYNDNICFSFIMHLYWNQFFRWKLFKYALISGWKSAKPFKIDGDNSQKKLYYPLDALSYDFDVQFEIHSTIDFLLKRSKKRYASQFEKQFWRLECIVVSI